MCCFEKSVKTFIVFDIHQIICCDWRRAEQVLCYWVGQKVRLVFSVRLYCDNCHISVHFKKTYQTFCVAILILKMLENTQHFQHIMLYYFKKGRNN